MRKRMLVYPAVLAVAALGYGGATAFSGDPPPLPTYRVFDKPPGQHRLPAPLTGPFGTVHPGQARYVGTLDGKDVYLARVAGGGVCALHVEDSGDFGGGCSDGPPREPDVTAWREAPSDPMSVVVTAPDVYSGVKIDGRTHKPAHNAVLTQLGNGNHTVRSEGEAVSPMETSVTFEQ